MKITIISVGKIKEKFYREAIAEYAKRLSSYCKFEIIELQDEKTPDKASAETERLIKEKEAERIMKAVDEKGYLIALAINGKAYDSVQFSQHIEKLMITGNSHIQFVIGGSLGLADSVLKLADEYISFSHFTFPHQLMRVILAEQIYRAYRIMNHEPYHK
ncbi:MAG: 23S rRNA (pseudouridine(1915)-N(3))-methyltransferase RlmH [Lachnospiraceae bacterium]|nr:23S rRNA (pseudouridine(1915)-N(3))-methyltransferase RlmH [Lachnospiraceae bacterium]